jgi:hypothetical protein
LRRDGRNCRVPSTFARRISDLLLEEDGESEEDDSDEHNDEERQSQSKLDERLARWSPARH